MQSIQKSIVVYITVGSQFGA